MSRLLVSPRCLSLWPNATLAALTALTYGLILQELWVSYNPIDKLTGIEKLKCLKVLFMGNCKVIKTMIIMSDHQDRSHLQINLIYTMIPRHDSPINVPPPLVPSCLPSSYPRAHPSRTLIITVLVPLLCPHCHSSFSSSALRRRHTCCHDSCCPHAPPPSRCRMKKSFRSLLSVRAYTPHQAPCIISMSLRQTCYPLVSPSSGLIAGSPGAPHGPPALVRALPDCAACLQSTRGASLLRESDPPRHGGQGP